MVKLWAPSLRAIARAARTAAGVPSTANHAPLQARRLTGNKRHHGMRASGLHAALGERRQHLAAQAHRWRAGLSAAAWRARPALRYVLYRAVRHRQPQPSQRSLAFASVVPSTNRARQCAALPPGAGCGARNDLADEEALRAEQLRQAAGQRSGTDKGNGFHLDSREQSSTARRCCDLCIVSP